MYIYTPLALWVEGIKIYAHFTSGNTAVPKFPKVLPCPEGDHEFYDVAES